MIRFVRPSKAVTNGQKIVASLEAASVEISADVARAMEGTFAPWLEDGETAPSQEQFRQVLLGRWLRRTGERLVAADEAHQKAVRAERKLRRQRDQAAEEIEAKLRAIRTTFERVYGAGLTDEVLGLEGAMPEDPVLFQRYARRIVTTMTDPDLALPDPRVKGSAMGPEDLVADLTPPLERLEQALEQHEPLKRRTQLALGEKVEALKAFNSSSGRIARYLEALCFLAGLDFHAERVRRSSHVQVEQDETFEPDDEEEADSDSEAEGDDPEETDAEEDEGRARV